MNGYLGNNGVQPMGVRSSLAKNILGKSNKRGREPDDSRLFQQPVNSDTPKYAPSSKKPRCEYRSAMSKTVHTGLLRFLEASDISSGSAAKNNFNRGLRAHDNNRNPRPISEALMSSSINGYNIFHDFCRIAPRYPDVLVKFSIFYARVKQILTRKEMQRILTSKAENSITVLSSAVASGNILLLKEIWKLVSEYCTIEMQRELLKNCEVHEFKSRISLIDSALFINRRTQSSELGRYECLNWVINKMLELEVCSLDQIVVELEKNKFFQPKPSQYSGFNNPALQLKICLMVFQMNAAFHSGVYDFE